MLVWVANHARRLTPQHLEWCFAILTQLDWNSVAHKMLLESALATRFNVKREANFQSESNVMYSYTFFHCTWMKLKTFPSRFLADLSVERLVRERDRDILTVEEIPDVKAWVISIGTLGQSRDTMVFTFIYLDVFFFHSRTPNQLNEVNSTLIAVDRPGTHPLQMDYSSALNLSLVMYSLETCPSELVVFLLGESALWIECTQPEIFQVDLVTRRDRQREWNSLQHHSSNHWRGRIGSMILIKSTNYRQYSTTILKTMIAAKEKSLLQLSL